MAKPKRIAPRTGLNFAAGQRPILEAFQLVDDGQVLFEAADDLKKATAFLTRNGGAATVTITLSLKQKGRHTLVTASSSVKLPKVATAEVALFVDDNHNLTGYDPDEFVMEELLEEATNPDAK